MEHGILSQTAEFARFRGILWNSVLADDNGTNTAYFGLFQVAITTTTILLAK